MLRVCFSVLAMIIGMAVLPSAQSAAPDAKAADAKAVKPAAIVNLNTATVQQLETLPGIGAKVAQRIVDYRQKNGPFKKIEELMNVQGIGEKSFLKLRAQLTVSAKPDASAQH